MTKVEFTIPIHSVTDTIKKEAENKAKEAYVMTLLKHGEISSGKASQLLGISRLDMIELMSKYEISLFDDSMSLEEFQSEINQARMGLKTNNFSRGLPIVSLVGVIILAKEQGLIDSVKSILDDLIIKGTRISPKIYNYALITAGEV